MIHAELNILLHLLLILNYVLLDIFFTLFGIKTQGYGSSIELQLPPHLLTLTVYGLRIVSLEFISIIFGLAWHG